MSTQIPGTAQDGDQPKAKVFISYSRQDMAFVDRLEAALTARGFDPKLDRTEIFAFEEWWARIETLIVQADTVVFVLSPDAVASRVCEKEVNFAASLNKRLAPIVYRQVDDAAVPEALARKNFIFFDDDTRFEESISSLVEALNTDIEWIRKHTQFGEAAGRWHAAGRPGPGGLMLRPPLLDEAEAWITLRPRKAPELTETTRAFIAASREAFDQEEAARLTSHVNLLTQVGEAEQLRGNFDTALKLCVYAARRDLETKQRISEPTRAAATLAAVVSQAGWRILLCGHEDAVQSAAFNSDGSRIVTGSGDKTARIWEAATGNEITVLRGHEHWVNSAVFSPDGTRIVTASRDETARIWDAVTGKEITVLRGHENSVSSAALSHEG